MRHRFQSSEQRLVYEWLMVVMATLVGLNLLLEFLGVLSPQQLTAVRSVNRFVWMVFLVDYGLRFYVSGDRKAFVRHHIPELIAILPLGSVFRLARLARLQTLVPLLRTVRAVVFIQRAYDGLLKRVLDHRLYRLALLMFALIAGGSVAIWQLEPGVERLGDAAWWTIVTMTTVGYGDLVPETAAGRWIAAALMLLGWGVLAAATGTLATYYLEHYFRQESGSSQEPGGEPAVDRQLADLIKSKIDRVDQLDDQEFETLIGLMRQLRHAGSRDDQR